MLLTKLPIEILREVLAHAVNVRGVKRALRLRLVNRLFSIEVTESLFPSAVLKAELEGQDSKIACRWTWIENPHERSFWQSYLVWKILKEKSSAEAPLAAVYLIAEELNRRSKSDSADSIRTYVSMLCASPREFILRPAKPLDHNSPKTLLQAAIITGCTTVAKELLTSFTDTSPLFTIDQNRYWSQPVLLAASSGNTEILEMIFSRVLFQPHKDRIREWVFSHAVAAGQLETAKLALYPRWGPVDSDITWTVLNTQRYLTSGATQSNHSDFYQQIISLAETVSSPGKSFSAYRLSSLLQRVAAGYRDRLDVVEQLLNHGAAVQQKVPPKNYREWREWEFGNSLHVIPKGQVCPLNPLFQAAKRGHERIVWFLLSHGADPNMTDDDTLFWAVNSASTKVVRLLVEHGADVNHVPDWKERPTTPPYWWKRVPPIFIALDLEHEQMARYLHAHGATVDVPGFEVFTQHAKATGLESMLDLASQLRDLERAVVNF